MQLHLPPSLPILGLCCCCGEAWIYLYFQVAARGQSGAVRILMTNKLPPFLYLGGYGTLRYSGYKSKGARVFFQDFLLR